MTPQIALTFAVLTFAVVLFVTERVRVDLVALLVLASLALTNLVTPEEALSGFSNPAVVTVWAVFVLSGGLSRTGIAGMVGRQVMRLAGSGEIRLLVVIMTTSAVLSAFMNNVGVTAMMLPVVVEIARRTRRPPSRLLMPLAFGCLLGGLTTLIGTPPNILAADALDDFGLQPFSLFDYAPVGVVVTVVGIAFMVLVGRHLLPGWERTARLRDPSAELGEIYAMEERLFIVRLPEHSVLAGKTLAESRLGSVLGLNVIGIFHNDRMQLAPSPDKVLESGDRLLVAGRLDRLDELREHQSLIIEAMDLSVDRLTSEEIGLAEVTLMEDSALIGQTLQQADFRRRFDAIVLAMWRDGRPVRTNLDNIPLRVDDILLIQGRRKSLEALRDSPDVRIYEGSVQTYRLHERLATVKVPPDSILSDKTLAESRISEAFGFAVLGIIRNGDTHLMPSPDERLQPGDILIVKGRAENVLAVRGLKDLQVDTEAEPRLETLESEQVGVVEIVVSPHANLEGQTLRELHFREKYGLNVLAIHRGGRAYRSNLRDMPLRYGDALLLFGSREKLAVLRQEPDFLVLAGETQTSPRLDKAVIAAGLMLGVVATVLLGWLPISIAAVAGAALMVLTGCLTMEEAYRQIDWKAVFLIAGMLPLGIAMENSGAARFIAEEVVNAVGGFGLLALVGGLFTLTSLASQFMPNPVVIVLMAPIALNTAFDLGLSPHALMMVVALSASASFLSPVGHPANVLVMGPGGYRFTDYLKVGLPLTVLVLLISLFILPVFWPLT